MEKLHSSDLYCCLTLLNIGEKPFDLGRGIQLLPSYVHVMAYTMLAVQRPKRPNQHHPGPLAATGQGFSFDSDVVLYIPHEYKRLSMASEEVALRIAALMRLWVDPRIRLTLMATEFPNIATLKKCGAVLHLANAIEVQPWHFQLAPATERDSMADLAWVREHWETALDLIQNNAAFRLALDAVANVQLIHSSALGLVSVWAALEALFSASTTELRFRMSMLIAAYLKPPGSERAATQKRVLKLYDARSAAAHGAPKHTTNDLLASLELLREVLISMIHARKIPTREELESLLFGV